MTPSSFASRSAGGWALSLVFSLSMAACGSDEGEGASPAAGGTPSTGGSGGDAAGTGGTGGSGGSGTTPDDGPVPPIPAALQACPTLTNGVMQFSGTEVLMFVGERREDVKGPVLFYWHGTGSVKEEVQAFMQPQVDDVVARGGLVASFSTSTGGGAQTGPFVWFESDYEMADFILACAVEQLNVDTRRIFTAGCSAGGLQSGNMLYQRSSYVAGVMPNSGGVGQPGVLQDPLHVPALMTAHGAPGADVVVIDFSVQSAVLDTDIAALGGFVVNCNHGGGHCGILPEIVAAQWQFVNDHPYGFTTSPYENGLPDTFPSYCEIIR